MTMKSSTRQVNGVTIVDLSGRITLGEGSVVLRDTVRDLLSKGQKKILLNLGDVRRLEGQLIEIHGQVKLYNGRAEIILNRVGQLTGGSTLIPPLPKNYDVEKRGHYSAGKMRPSTKPKKIKPTPADSATYGKEKDADAEGSDPPD